MIEIRKVIHTFTFATSKLKYLVWESVSHLDVKVEYKSILDICEDDPTSQDSVSCSLETLKTFIRLSLASTFLGPQSMNIRVFPLAELAHFLMALS